MENNELIKLRNILIKNGFITFMDLVGEEFSYKEAFETIKGLCIDNIIEDNGDGRFALLVDGEKLNEYFSIEEVWIEELDVATMSDAVSRMDTNAYIVLKALNSKDGVTKEELARAVKAVMNLDGALTLLEELKLIAKSGEKYYTRLKPDDFEIISTTYLRLLRTRLKENLDQLNRTEEEKQKAAEEEEARQRQADFLTEAGVRKEDVDRILDSSDDDDEDLDYDDDDFDDEEDADDEDIFDALDEFTFDLDNLDDLLKDSEEDEDDATDENENDEDDEKIMSNEMIDDLLAVLEERAKESMDNASQEAETDDASSQEAKSDNASGLDKIMSQMAQAKKKKNGGNN